MIACAKNSSTDFDVEEVIKNASPIEKISLLAGESEEWNGFGTVSSNV